jgi:hypothetical protein
MNITSKIMALTCELAPRGYISYGAVHGQLLHSGSLQFLWWGRQQWQNPPAWGRPQKLRGGRARGSVVARAEEGGHGHSYSHSHPHSHSPSHSHSHSHHDHSPHRHDHVHDSPPVGAAAVLDAQSGGHGNEHASTHGSCCNHDHHHHHYEPENAAQRVFAWVFRRIGFIQLAEWVEENWIASLATALLFAVATGLNMLAGVHRYKSGCPY